MDTKALLCNMSHITELDEYGEPIEQTPKRK